MILLDTNLLVYAYVPILPQQNAAGTWLDSQLNRTGLPCPHLLNFIRLVGL